MRVIEFSKGECPFLKRENTWQEFHIFRNGVLDILSAYGSVGPSGKLPILDAWEESYDEWHKSDSADDPDFYVVSDDMYGMSVRLEAEYSLVKPALLEELAMMLKMKQFEGWSVYMALEKGGLWVFADRVLHEGEFFKGCGSVEELYQRCSA